uniref:Secreted protein n=1 Tax=Ascaris lumbricoides TaxID=6252 RepID=A0A0M3I2H3_ASCLU
MTNNVSLFFVLELRFNTTSASMPVPCYITQHPSSFAGRMNRQECSGFNGTSDCVLNDICPPWPFEQSPCVRMATK